MKVLLHIPKIDYPIVVTDSPHVIDGVEAFKTLCPISKESGIRESPLRMLESLANDPDKKRVLDSVLQELPVVRSIGESLSDGEKFDMLIHRVDVGTKAEVSQFIENSRSYLESLFAVGKNVEAESTSDTIKFDESETTKPVES